MQFSEQEIGEFKIEAAELLESSERSLLALDEGGDFQAAYDSIFRCFHSLKGSAGMMEFTRLQAHMHQLESTFIGYKDAGGIPKAQVDQFLQGVDAAKHLLNDEEAAATAKLRAAAEAEAAAAAAAAAEAARKKQEDLFADPSSSEGEGETGSVPEGMPDSAMGEFVAECEEISERVSMNFGLVEKGDRSHELIDSIYRDIHSLKGSAQLFGFNRLGELAHAMESILEPVRDKKKTVTPQLVDVLFRCMDVIDRRIEGIKSGQPLQLSAEVGNLIPKLAESAAAPVAELHKNESPAVRGESMKDESAPVETSAPAAQAQAQSSAPSAAAPQADAETGTIRVPVGLLDRLMALMGEMVLVRNQVLQYANRNEDLEFLNLSQRLNVVTGEIQGEMMKTRMQPIGNVLNKFHRVVRDLSKELGKKVELEISGAETELDKTLLEAIKDPLTHIIRNSCDHGIETPDQRKEAHKPDCGRIGVRAYHEGGQVIIEIRDDGKGLNPEKLVAKAVEKGLISRDKAAAMGAREAYNLIFAPGFSTAAAVTNVSGRGVGMDVVRNNVERIGGSIDLESQTGAGMTIRLKIPLTLAIVPAMIIRCGEDQYAIPQLKLVELVRVEKSSENKIEYLQGKPVFRLRGNILPLLDLKGVLGMDPATGELAERDGAVNIVVLNAESQYFGLIVDEILDTADIVVKPLTRFLKNLSVYSGATVLGDGSVALILDVVGIAQQQQLHTRTGAERGDSASDARLCSQDAQEFLLFRLNSPTKHALVLGYVHRLEEFKRSAIEYSGEQAVVRYRGAILPVIDLNRYLGYAKPPQQESSDVVPVIVTQKGDSFFGIEVNEILDVLSTEAMLDTSITDRDGILGNLPTEQEVVVVVDLRTVLSDFGRPSSGAEPSRPKAPSRERRPTESAGPGVRILYAEDTAFFRRHVARVLEDAGHRVTTAINGEEALKVLESAAPGDFDLVLSDIEMPKMNGLELARSVRSNGSWSRVPMMALTTKSGKSSVQDGLKAGFDAYLEKMSPPELLDAITDLVSKKKDAA